MSLTSLRFFAFLIILIIVYYLVPKKLQWWLLLAASLFFYALTGWKNLIFILITATSSYGAARWMRAIAQTRDTYLKEAGKELSKDEKKAYKKRRNTQRKWIMIATMVLNFGLLCVFKYTNFLIEQINGIVSGASLSFVSFIVPLGISFYTFQTMGYVADIYWEKYEPQTNYGKLVLFTSFFPQITQGPISDYRQLTGELFTEHSFTYENFSRGAQRFIWGLLKKLALADQLSVYVHDVFANFRNYSGWTVLLGAFCYAIQIYADFSGYMDMMCGLCEILGIRLAENFERPYFSKSIEEYWRRWHITLGAWFRTYVYYPVACTKWAINLGKKGKKKLGATFGKAIPGTIALIVTWFITGLWHGATWGYILWGLLNGLFIIATLWLGPFYEKCTTALHINTTGWGWKTFQVVRTFVILTFIKVFPEVGSLQEDIAFWKQIFIAPRLPHSFAELAPYVDDYLNLAIIVIVALLVLIADLLQRKKPVRDYFNRVPVVLRIVILAVFFVIALEFGWRANQMGGGEFMYANF